MCTQRTFPRTFKKTLSVDSHTLNYFECVCIKAIHYSRSVHITTKKIENSRPTPSNTPISKSPERLTGKQFFKSHKIYPPCNVKEVPQKRYSFTPISNAKNSISKEILRYMRTVSLHPSRHVNCWQCLGHRYIDL